MKRETHWASEMSAEAKCKDCQSRTPDRFCKWLQAFLQPGLSDDAGCEGYVPSAQQERGKDKPCPKADSKRRETMIVAALELKKLKGSVILEHVNCGKHSCHCQHGSLHPANYLHYYSNGKIKRRYLSKAVSALLSHSEGELEGMIRETVSGQGQGGEKELEEST
jgi:hypothetical protein